MITLPGLIDPHVHLRDLGQDHKEDFASGATAAIAGGFTTILDMPNNKIPITTEQLLLKKQKTASAKILCDIGFYFGSVGNNLQEFEKIKNKTKGLKIFLNETTGNLIIDLNKFEKICQSWPNHLPILLHAEENILQKALEIGLQFRQKIHVCHVSSKKELSIILKAKNRGVVTCGVTPHHLFLTNDEAALKMAEWNEVHAKTPREWIFLVKPSLKSKTDQDFLWQHLKDIDTIESDHAPHTLDEKQKGAFGFPGLETTLPLLLTAAHQNKLTIEDIIRLCYTNPSKIFMIKESINPGKVRMDSPGISLLKTRIEIDESEEWTIQNQNLFTKAKWSPFNGWKVKGKIKKVNIRGTLAFENDKILVQPGFGKII
jgi:carbamoyl-phosphate synthase/aspartate carbamoyltransferase/dihydroorotase